MPEAQVFFYCEEDGSSPVVDWLDELSKKNVKALHKCAARIEALAQMGHELRRPASDFLRDGVYELRARQGKVQYRILYFFHGNSVAVLAHSIVKKDSAVPPADIEKALKRKKVFERNPDQHTYREKEE